MASLGDVGRALGYTVLAGFGTAEEQRLAAERERDRKFRERQLQELVTSRLQQARETQRLHDLEWGYATPEELAPYLPAIQQLGLPVGTSGRIRRRDLPSLVTEAGRRTRAEPEMVDLRRVGKAFGYEMPPEEIPTAPAGPGTPGYGIGEEAAAGFAPTSVRAAAPFPVPAKQVGEVSTFLRGLADRSERAQKAKDTAAARRELAQGGNLEAILAKYPTLTAKDVAGYEPLAPDKPRVLTGPNGEVLEVSPPGTAGQRVTTLRPGQPDEGKTLDLEYKRLRNKGLRERGTAQDMIDAIENGKPFDVNKATLMVQRMGALAAKETERAHQASLDGDTASQREASDLASVYRDVAARLSSAIRVRTEKLPGGRPKATPPPNDPLEIRPLLSK